MASTLIKHPLAMEAYFEKSIVLTFALPKEQLAEHIPKALELDTFQDQWAFIAIALVKTKGLRPKGAPRFMGRDLYLLGYRIFVRYQDRRGKRLRGLYILKSETDNTFLHLTGNLFTAYNYHKVRVQEEIQNNIWSYTTSSGSAFTCVSTEQANLPKDSIFDDWKAARRFAGPMPFTFSFDEKNNEVSIVEGVRTNWKPRPIEITNYSFRFLEEYGFQTARFVSAFVVEDIPYHWKKAKHELWSEVFK